jgi:type VI secretion system lysozyme-like protein
VIEGARASLVDRLIDRDPRSSQEARPLRILDRRAMKESVRRDLGWLLNTRSPIAPRQLEGQDRTVVNYGIPDFSALSPQNDDDHRRVALDITRTINAYEPRLTRVRVVVDEYRDDERSLRVRVDAILAVGDIEEPVSFGATVRSSTGEAVIDAV